jgi:Tol biopolymer transport system component
MGVVYEAVDQELGRRVAIKFLASGTPGDAHAVLRLRREAHAASALNHPNICTVHELGEHEGRPFIVFELLEGSTLGASLAGRPLPFDTILELGSQIASALEAAHRAGIVHRDIKPSNLFVTGQRQIKVLDFGLAKPDPRRLRSVRDETETASRSEGPITEEGVAVGTAAYMSPEQALGDEVDHRTDIFSFGAVLYEMATGRQAFGGPTRTAVHEAVLHLVPPPPSSLNPAIPEAFDAIVAKALEKDRELRYQSAAEIRVDLQRLRRDSGSGPSAARKPATVSTPRPEQRPRAWWAAALIGALLLAALVTAAIMWPRGRDEPDPFGAAVSRQLTSATGWESEPAVSPDGSVVAFASNEGGSAHIWAVGGAGGHTRVTSGPASDTWPAWVPDGSAILFTSDRTGGPAVWKVPWPAGPPSLVVSDAADPAVSPDGTRIAFVRADERAGGERIFVAPLADVGRARELTSDSGGLWDHTQPAWSPDGEAIAYRAQGSLWTVPSRGGREKQLIGDGYTYERPAWSGDGLWIYFSANRDGNFAIWRIASSGGAPRRITLGTGSERMPSLSRDGGRLAYSTLAENTDLVLHDMVSGRELVYGSDRMEHMPVFARDGGTVFFVSDRRAGRDELWAVPVEGGQWGSPARPLTELAGSVSHPTCSPDGRWLAYYEVAGNERDIWVVSVHGGAPIRFTDDPAADIHPEWAPDGRRIAFVSERGGGSHVWVQHVDNGHRSGTALQITRGQSVELAPAWSADGSSIAYVVEPRDRAGDVWIVSADGQGQPRRITSGSGAARVRWNHVTGKLLVAGYWGGGALRLRVVDPVSGTAEDLRPPIDMTQGEYRPDFDVSWNGRSLVLSRDQVRGGDIWVLDKPPARR